MAGKYAFDEGNLDLFTQERRHAAGFFARVITEAEAYESENSDHVMGRITSVALADPDDPSSIVKGTQLTEWKILPLANPDVDGHEVQEWMGRMWTPYCAALFYEECSALPSRAQYDAEKKKFTGPIYFNGEELEANSLKDPEVKALEKEAIKESGHKAAEVAENWASIVGKGYYCRVIQEKTDEGDERPAQKNYYAEKPEWWELNDTFIEVVGANGANGAEVSKGGKRGGKKADKKASKRSRRK